MKFVADEWLCFQNYNLFTNLSVFDNVSFVLKMIGVNDEEFIKEQVEYALDLVNMLPFAKKRQMNYQVVSNKELLLQEHL